MALRIEVGISGFIDGEVGVHRFGGSAPSSVTESTRPVVDLGNTESIHHGIVEDASEVNVRNRN
jgi:hypothetical protein